MPAPQILASRFLDCRGLVRSTALSPGNSLLLVLYPLDPQLGMSGQRVMWFLKRMLKE